MNKYKYNIDGLRAISVLLVLFYHVKLPLFSGGFIGVDVFFVISGFLITKIIYPKIKSGTFSYYDFYNKRIKRILPIFYLVLFSTIIAGYFILLPSDYILLLKSSLYSSFFAANIFTILETSGYFNAGTETMPLLHIWSLSVEEQFYFIWPVALYFLYKFNQKRKIVFLLILGLLSFFFAEFYNDTKLSYFLLPTRAGELMLGGIIAIWSPSVNFKKSNKEIFTLLGILTIFICSLYITKSTPFPGLWSLIPCFAALLILVFAEGTVISRVLLENKLSVHLGRLSYGMYLWHWPIVAYVTYLGVDFEFEVQVLILLTTYLAALFSYHLVENPIRYSNLNWNSSYKMLLLLPMSTIALLYVITWKFDGFEHRFTQQELSPLSNINDLSYFRGGVCFLSNDYPSFGLNYNKEICNKLSKDRKNVLLLGDSHSAHLYSGLNKVFSNTVNIIQANTSGCKVNIDAKSPSRCKELYSYIFDDYLIKNKNEIKEVWLASRWDIDDYNKVIKAIEKVKSINSNIKIVVFGPVPEYEYDLPKLMALDNIYKITLVVKFLRKKPNEVDEYFSKKFNNVREGVSYISLYKLLCFNNKCSYVTPSGEPIHFDYGHLTKFGSLYLAEKIKTQYVN